MGVSVAAGSRLVSNKVPPDNLCQSCTVPVLPDPAISASHLAGSSVVSDNVPERSQAKATA